MSREFGDNGNAFFHWKMQNCLDDLKDEAREDFHKKFIPLFEELYEIAYAISSVEAGDSGLYRSIFQTMESLPKIQKWVGEMNEVVYTYRQVAERAVQKAAEEKK